MKDQVRTNKYYKIINIQINIFKGLRVGAAIKLKYRSF